MKQNTLRKAYFIFVKYFTLNFYLFSFLLIYKKIINFSQIINKKSIVKVKQKK